MAENQYDIKGVKIFIASSGELAEERKQCIPIVHSVSKLYPHLKLEVVEWETDMESGNCGGSIQKKIDPLLLDSDIAIVLFYSKAGNFTLGEYRLAMDNGKKVFVYFKEGFSPKTMEQMENYKKILELKEQLNKENQTLYVEYKTIEEFESIMKKDLSLYLSRNSEYGAGIKHIPIPANQNNLNNNTNTYSPVTVGDGNKIEITYNIGGTQPSKKT